MKILSPLICFSVLCLTLPALAADDTVSFSGTWVIDSQKSDPAPRPVLNLGAPGDSGRGGGMGGMGGGGGMGGMGGGGGMGGMGGGGFGGPRGGGVPGGQPVQPGEPAPLIIKQTENEIELSSMMKMGGKDVPIVEKFMLDGKDVEDTVPAMGSKDPVKRITQVSLKKNKLQVKQKTKNPAGDGETKREYSLSKDGKQLTLFTKTTTVIPAMRMPNMAPMPATVWQTEQKQVYNKQ